MSDPHGAHRAAAESAIFIIGDVQELIQRTVEQTDQALAAINLAVGAGYVESATNARDAMLRVRQQVEEAFPVAEQAKEELFRYARGF